MRLLFVAFYLILANVLPAQYTLTVNVNAPGNDSLFIAGSFNQWNPAGPGYKLARKSNGQYSIRLKNLQAGNYEFKFTHGSWAKVECRKNGSDSGNRSFNLQSDDTLDCTIEAWKEDYAVVELMHTQCSHVRIMDTAFVIPQLNRTRRIWIYLPDGYAQTKTRYPVLYLQDGQNIFDGATSFAGEWGVDETLDSLSAKGVDASIIVGIDNGGEKRLSEYTPYDFELKGDTYATQKINGEGDAYLNFLVNTLKPYIDSVYRTRPEKKSTLIAGSSMGGLISFYALMKYPDVFGGAGVFSPAFWLLPQLNDSLQKVVAKMNAKIFFYAGEKESKNMVSDMDSIANIVGSKSSSIIYKIVDPEGKHDEPAWRKWFPEFYQWIIGEGYDGRIKLE